MTNAGQTTIRTSSEIHGNRDACERVGRTAREAHRRRRATSFVPSSGGPSMSATDEYEASPWEWVRDQVEKYEASGGKEAGDLRGVPVIILTTVGNKSGKIRKTP